MKKQITAQPVEDNVRAILSWIGEDVNREGLLDTPRRFLAMLKDMATQTPFNFTTFDNEGMDEMIIVKDIPFYSLCEHHMAPFFGTATIAYIPGSRIVGISKLPRTLDFYAAGLQNQERITTQIANRLQKELNPIGVAVLLKATHLCMCMRGVKKEGATTVTSKMVGAFLSDLNARQEFLKLCT